MTKVEETEVVTAEPEVSLEDARKRLLKAASPRMQAQVKEGIVNPIELAKALGVRPQMIYSYIRNGKLKSSTLNSTQKLVVAIDDAVAYAQRVYSRQLRKQLKNEAELRGEKV